MQNMADFLHTSFSGRLDISQEQHSSAAVADRHTGGANGAAVHLASSSSSSSGGNGSNGNFMDRSVNGNAMPSQQTHPSSSPPTSSPTDWRVGGPLDTFLVYNDRRKVTSSAKRRRKPNDTNLHQVRAAPCTRLELHPAPGESCSLDKVRATQGIELAM